MKLPSNANYSLFHRKLVRFLVIEVGALLTSILFAVSIGGAVASIAGYVYDTNHAIPNPAIRGDDMGAGLIMVAAALGSLLISLPIAVLIHVYVFKRFFPKEHRK